jgi:CRP-like cAMP-binding protein
MNREELALYLNTTRPSLSRTLLSLQEDGFIHLSSRKSIKILDAEALLYIE